MRTYEDLDKTPRYQDVKIGTYISSNYEEKDRSTYDDFFWGCGKCRKLYDVVDYVSLCELRNEEFFVCPAVINPRFSFLFIKFGSYICHEKLRGEKKSFWENKYLIHAVR